MRLVPHEMKPGPPKKTASSRVEVKHSHPPLEKGGLGGGESWRLGPLAALAENLCSVPRTVCSSSPRAQGTIPSFFCLFVWFLVCGFVFFFLSPQILYHKILVWSKSAQFTSEREEHNNNGFRSVPGSKPPHKTTSVSRGKWKSGNKNGGGKLLGAKS